MLRLTSLVILILFTMFAVTANGQKQPENSRTLNSFEEQIKAFKNNKKYLVKYDKFDDRTRIYAGQFTLSKSYKIGLTFGFSFKGQTYSRDDTTATFALFFEAINEDYLFTSNHKLVALVGNERIDLGDGEYKSRVNNPRYTYNNRILVTEEVGFLVKADAFGKIAEQKNTAFRLGGFEFIFNDEQKQSAIDMFSLSQNK